MERSWDSLRDRGRGKDTGVVAGDLRPFHPKRLLYTYITCRAVPILGLWSRPVFPPSYVVFFSRSRSLHNRTDRITDAYVCVILKKTRVVGDSKQPLFTRDIYHRAPVHLSVLPIFPIPIPISTPLTLLPSPLHRYRYICIYIHLTTPRATIVFISLHPFPPKYL